MGVSGPGLFCCCSQAVEISRCSSWTWRAALAPRHPIVGGCSYVGYSQLRHAAVKCWVEATFYSWTYDVGVSRHEDPKSWFWLRGADGAARALAAVRHQAGLTQAQIARQLKMDRTTVLNMEAGRNPAVNRFIGLFNWMGYDLIAVPRGARVIVDTRTDADAVR